VSDGSSVEVVLEGAASEALLLDEETGAASWSRSAPPLTLRLVLEALRRVVMMLLFIGMVVME